MMGALQKAPARAVQMSHDMMDVLERQVAIAMSSRLFPSIDSLEKAVLIAMKGQELGLPPIYALTHLHIIKGRVCGDSEQMLSLILRDFPNCYWYYAELSTEACEIHAARSKDDTPCRFRFTIEDAKRANLLSKKDSVWLVYPRAMLRSRCISETARSLFPDAIGGMSYTPEELGSLPGEIIDDLPKNTYVLDHERKEPTTLIAAAPAAPKSMIFDPSVEVYRNAVIRWLDQYEPALLGRYDEIAQMLTGRPTTDLKNVINELPRILETAR